jgi:hypothetical protein
MSVSLDLVDLSKIRQQPNDSVLASNPNEIFDHNVAFMKVYRHWQAQ